MPSFPSARTPASLYPPSMIAEVVKGRLIDTLSLLAKNCQSLPKGTSKRPA